jgi:hypothetical protein
MFRNNIGGSNPPVATQPARLTLPGATADATILPQPHPQLPQRHTHVQGVPPQRQPPPSGGAASMSSQTSQNIGAGRTRDTSSGGMNPNERLARRMTWLAGHDPWQSQLLVLAIDELRSSGIRITPDQANARHRRTIQLANPGSSIQPSDPYELTIEVQHGQIARVTLRGDTLDAPLVAPLNDWGPQARNGLITIRNPHGVHLEMQWPGTGLCPMHTVHHAFQMTLPNSRQLASATLAQTAAEITRLSGTHFQPEFVADYQPSSATDPNSLEARLDRNCFAVFELGNLSTGDGGHQVLLIHRSGRDTGHCNGQWVVLESGMANAGVAPSAVAFGTLQEALAHIAQRNSEYNNGQWALSLTRPTTLLRMPAGAPGVYVAHEGWVPLNQLSQQERLAAGIDGTQPSGTPRTRDAGTSPAGGESTSVLRLAPAGDGGPVTQRTRRELTLRESIRLRRQTVIRRANAQLQLRDQGMDAGRDPRWLRITANAPLENAPLSAGQRPRLTARQRESLLAWASAENYPVRAGAARVRINDALRYFQFLGDLGVTSLSNADHEAAVTAYFALGGEPNTPHSLQEAFGIVLTTTLTGRQPHHNRRTGDSGTSCRRS